MGQRGQQGHQDTTMTTVCHRQISLDSWGNYHIDSCSAHVSALPVFPGMGSCLFIRIAQGGSRAGAHDTWSRTCCNRRAKKVQLLCDETPACSGSGRGRCFLSQPWPLCWHKHKQNQARVPLNCAATLQHLYIL